MPEGERNLRQRVQEQTVHIARDFFGDTLGRLEGKLRGDRAQLKELAEQLPEGEAHARLEDMVSSYSRIEESICRVASDTGVEDVVNEPTRQTQKENAEEPERSARGPGDVVGVVAGGAGQAAGQAGQAVEGTQEAVGRVLDLVGQVTENLPGGRLLNRTTDESGQTVQRAADASGNIFEITLNEAGDLVDQRPVGSLAELPAEEECQNEEGQTIRTVEESGTLVELRLGADGEILDMQVLPPSEN